MGEMGEGRGERGEGRGIGRYSPRRKTLDLSGDHELYSLT